MTKEKEKEEWDIKAYMTSLPTRVDMDHYVQRMEKAYKTEIQEIKTIALETHGKIEGMNIRMESLEKELKQVKEKMQQQEKDLKQAVSTMDEQENRSRRNNIRIRGLKESVTSEMLLEVIQKIFSNILQDLSKAEILIDRVHRAMAPRKGDVNMPRDVICKLHYPQTKEKIMAAVRKNNHIQYEGSNLLFFQDLSKLTLDKRRALKPLLEQLRIKNKQYRWKFPFQLQVQHEGQTVIFREMADLEDFQKKLQLPEVKILDWPKDFIRRR